MAFKILNNEEISLLNDNQRVQYEKELDLYQQRVAFVEQLEKLENADIEPYEPKLKPIAVINQIEIESFKKPEYILSIGEPVAKPDVNIIPFENIEPINPVLPLIPKRPTVQLKHLQSIENVQPDLPSIYKPTVAIKRYEKTDRKLPDLPDIVEPNIVIKSFIPPRKSQSKLPSVMKPLLKTDLSFEKLKNNHHNIPNHIPDVVMPNIDINPFAISVKTQFSLPETSILFTEVKAFSKPEHMNAKLPTVDKPNIRFGDFKEVELAQPNLPNVSEITVPVKVTFQTPEQSNAELPTVVMPNIHVHSFKEAKCVAPSLPKVPKFSVPSIDFSRPEYSEPGLPTVKEVNIGSVSFEKPVNNSPKLPMIDKVHIEVKTFNRCEKTQPNLVTVQTPNIAVKPFTQVERNIPQPMERSIAKAPNVDSKLKKLLHVMNEECAALKG